MAVNIHSIEFIVDTLDIKSVYSFIEANIECRL